MVKIAVCDDEEEITAGLELALADILGAIGVEHEIRGFSSARELCRSLQAGERYGLIFLDIAFSENEINGVETGWIIREVHKDNAVSIVYISWEKRYAMELFKIRPLDFMIKPLARGEIERAVETYLEISTPPGGKAELAYKKGHLERSARIKDIVYLEARDRKVVIHLCDGGKDDFYGALKDVYEEQLKRRDFLFVHASFAVNYDYVTAVKYNSLHVACSPTPLPVSRNRRDEVRRRYSAIMKRRGSA